MKASCNVLTTTQRWITCVCSRRVHDFTQAQRTDRSTRVYQRSSTLGQHSCSAHNQSNKIAAFHAYTSHCRRTQRIVHTCLVLAAIHSAQINQGSEILQRPWCAYLRLSRKEVMTFITTENRVVHFAKHRYSRVYLSHAAVTHNCVNSLNSLPRPQAAQGTSKTDCRGQMGGSPKSPRNSIWQGKPLQTLKAGLQRWRSYQLFQRKGERFERRCKVQAYRAYTNGTMPHISDHVSGRSFRS